MANLLLGLAVSVVLATAPATSFASETTAHPQAVSTSGVHKAPIHRGPVRKHTNLSSSECTQLGGTVSNDTSCNGVNKVCTVVTWNSATNRGSTHTLCLTQP